jgi:hypothetical protein
MDLLRVGVDMGGFAVVLQDTTAYALLARGVFNRFCGDLAVLNGMGV